MSIRCGGKPADNYNADLRNLCQPAASFVALSEGGRTCESQKTLVIARSPAATGRRSNPVE
ncbi:MAG: hypothetical protein UV67_C0032G0005 [Parcubacteria group bacterium GW2011_GWC1_43_12]|nr:MAG: hypothetical protein UV34_C0016G0009 [Parcubacteria group bacterium GW2011_GWB1_42_6]KKS91299.1 MAG: hypothetical protein UV67_C0032G0005 [Parcubacteria group bacterium GW2011_GWC1_43_12]